MSSQLGRRADIEALLGWTDELDHLRDRLLTHSWDAEMELAELLVANVGSVLARVAENRVTSGELTDWASLIEGRDDVGYEAKELREFVFEAANPSLEGPLDLSWRNRWIEFCKSWSLPI